MTGTVSVHMEFTGWHQCPMFLLFSCVFVMVLILSKVSPDYPG